MKAEPSQSSSRYPSPLRYPGGKVRLAPVIEALFEANNLVDGHYAEPYAGGAGLALQLLFREFAMHIHINDLDRSVYAFWYCVLKQTDTLCRRIGKAPLTVEEWRRQRAVQRDKGSADIVDLGFSTFYLNRTNRSGIIDSGGVIGGLDQLGTWGIDARYNRKALVRRIERIASYRDRISIYNQDAEHFLGEMATTLPARSLVYLDPPYYVKGTRRLYASYYNSDDHGRVATTLWSCPWPWVVSYDAAPEVLALYGELPHVRYQLRYSANGSAMGREAMFFSPDLRLPAPAQLRVGDRQRWYQRDAA